MKKSVAFSIKECSVDLQKQLEIQRNDVSSDSTDEGPDLVPNEASTLQKSEENGSVGPNLLLDQFHGHVRSNESPDAA